MKAVLYHRYGGSDVLQYEDVQRPMPGAGQVLVKVAATSFNPVDAGIRGGYLSEVYAITFPHVPGIDVAGTIAEIGDGVEGWNVGDAVVGMLALDGDGAAAEYVIAPAEVLTTAPRSVALADACSRVLASKPVRRS
jgi:NADPH:quinone reductase-like Zn-dependent oxidoreductase